MLRVFVKNDKVVCGCEDWNALQANERKFLSDCYWTACWTDFDGDGNLTMYEPASAFERRRTILNIEYNAKNNGIEVSDEVRAYAETLEQAAKEEQERARKAQEAQAARERWESRKKDGCDDCGYCQRMGDGWFKCKYSGDELDSRMSERWDGLRGVYELFYEVGVPNERCKDFYRETVKRKTEGT